MLFPTLPDYPNLGNHLLRQSGNLEFISLDNVSSSVIGDGRPPLSSGV